MTTFPGSPRLTRGALIAADLFNPLASVVLFQYNPKNLSRTIDPSYNETAGGREVMRLNGAPSETISVTVEIDAADQLESGDASAGSMGIYPQLSALEMMVYPKSMQVIANTALLAAGVIEIVPPEAPFTLFIWGIKRVVPVKIASISITEQEFDPRLNPIRAEAEISLQVLTYDNFPVTHPGFAAFMSHQIIKETMAAVNSAGSIPNIAT